MIMYFITRTHSHSHTHTCFRCELNLCVCVWRQVAGRYAHAGGLPDVRQHGPLLQPAARPLPAADAGGLRHRRYDHITSQTELQLNKDNLKSW